MNDHLCGHLWAVVLLLLLFGCASRKPAELRLLWPVPPDQPRLEFIGSYKTAGDLPHNNFSRWLEGVVGKMKEEVSLVKPHGIFAGSGRIYVADESTGNIMVFNFPERTVGPLLPGGLLKVPLNLVVDNSGDFFVADSGLGRVRVFSPEGVLKYDFGAAEALLMPAHLVMDEKLSRLYVADDAQNRVFVYDLSGQLLFNIGGEGESDGKLKGPRGMAVDHGGNLFVADSGNARVQVFDQNGRFLRKFGSRGTTVRHFVEPVDLAFDSEGNLHILDKGSAALLTYSPKGKVLLATGSGIKSRAPMGLARPTALHIDANDRIYIADPVNRRVSVWQYLSAEYLGNRPIEHAHLVKLANYLEETTPDGVNVSAEDIIVAHTSLRKRQNPSMVTGAVKCSSCGEVN